MEKAKAERRAKLEKAFKVFDADGSGTLDSAEMMKILTRESGDCAGMKIEDAKEIIEAFDKNGDGVLNLEEFIECMINLEEVEGFSFGNGEAQGGFWTRLSTWGSRALSLGQVLCRSKRRRQGG